MLTKEPISEEESMDGNTSNELPFATSSDSWCDANQRHLAAAISAIRSHVEAKLLGRNRSEGESSGTPAENDVIDPGEWTFSQPPALEQLCTTFELSTFERSMLLLAAGAEMDSRLAELYTAFDVTHHGLPTLKLALTTLPEAHWSVLSPAHALRHWQLIDLLPSETLIGSPFRLNERILHFLAGVGGLDERLHSVLRPVATPDLLPLSYTQLAMQVASVWTAGALASDTSSPTTQLPLIELCGADAEANRTVAACATAMLNLRLYALSPRGLAQSQMSESDLLLRLVEREAILSGFAVLVESADLLGLDSLRTFASARIAPRPAHPLSAPSTSFTKPRARSLSHCATHARRAGRTLEQVASGSAARDDRFACRAI